MSEPRFAGLLSDLRQAGVAPRHARRALLEISCHFDDLLASARARGADDATAHREATRLLGSQPDWVRHYASSPELHTWSRRCPGIFFALLPLLTYAAMAGACLLLISLYCQLNSVALHRLHIPAGVTDGIDAAAQIVFLWLMPWIVGGFFAWLAHRRGASMRWSSIAILGVSSLAAFCNVAVSISGGSTPGEVGAGIGISLETLPASAAHATLLALPAMLLLWLSAQPLRDAAAAPLD